MKIEIATTHSCIVCRGKGRLDSMLILSRKCPECQGFGEIIGGESIEWTRDFIKRSWHGFKAWFWNVDTDAQSHVISRQD